MKRLVVALFLLFLCIPTAYAEITHITCGGRGDRPCVIGDGEWWEGGLKVNGCDRGLDAEYIGYCRSRASWWPHPCISYRYPWQCRIGARNDESGHIGAPKFTDQLLAQIELGRNEPINWINLIGTHNAFNNGSDNYVKPNQLHSMTEQLDAGARVLFLDVHQEETCNCLKLAHAQADGLGDTFLDRHLIYGFREIREWLRDNPDQFVILRFETYFKEDQAENPEFAQESFRKMLAAELSPYLLPASKKPPDRWPTLTEMRANGWRAIAISDHPVNEWVHNGSYSNGTKAKGMVSMLGDGETPPLPTQQKFTHIEEDSLRYPTYGDTCTDYDGLLDNWTEGPGMICPLNEPCEKGGRHSLYDWCPMERIIPLYEVTKHGFSAVSFDRWRDYSTYTESGTEFHSDWPLHDLVWAGEYTGNDPDNAARDNLASAMSSVSGTWYDADPEEDKHFGCSYQRDGDPATWVDTVQGRGVRTVWEITTARGPWQDGWTTCASEFGDVGLVFSVPTNSWQNEDLKKKLEGLEYDVWLAYRDTDPEPGENHVAWDLDRGVTGSGITSDPSVAREGQLVRFESTWAIEDLFACTDQFDNLLGVASSDLWYFGDGSVPSASDSFEYTKDGVRFIKSHAFRDDRIPFAVRHVLPASCPDDGRSLAQVVFNVPPEIRANCDDWATCTDAVSREELTIYAGQVTTLTAAWFDAGIDDLHAAHFDWGDASQGTGIVAKSAESVDTGTGQVTAEHAYQACGSYRIDLSLTDIDGGRGTDYQMVQVEESPPTINCPPDLQVEAAGPAGAPANLGEPTIQGGYCGDVTVTNDGLATYPFGMTEVDWTASNSVASLNPDTGDYDLLGDACTQTVVVADTVTPYVRAPHDKIVVANRSGMDIGMAIATDAVGVIEIYNDAPATYAPGRTVVTWYARDEAGNVGQDTQVISANSSGSGGNGPVMIIILLVMAARRRFGPVA